MRSRLLGTLLAASLASCGGGTHDHGSTDADTDTDTGTGTGTESDTLTGSETDSETVTSSASETDSETVTNSASASDTDTGTGVDPVCERQDAQNDGTDCLELVGFFWDGCACYDVRCGCIGADCANGYGSERECRIAHGDCPVCGR